MHHASILGKNQISVLIAKQGRLLLVPFSKTKPPRPIILISHRALVRLRGPDKLICFVVGVLGGVALGVDFELNGSVFTGLRPSGEAFASE